MSCDILILLLGIHKNSKLCLVINAIPLVYNLVGMELLKNSFVYWFIINNLKIGYEISYNHTNTFYIGRYLKILKYFRFFENFKQERILKNYRFFTITQ